MVFPPCVSDVFLLNAIQDDVDYLSSLYNFTNCNTQNINLIKIPSNYILQLELNCAPITLTQISFFDSLQDCTLC